MRPSVYWRTVNKDLDCPTYRRRARFVIDELAQTHGWTIREGSPDGCQLAIVQRHAKASDISSLQNKGLLVIFETNDLHLFKANGVFYNPDEREIIETSDYVVAATRWMARVFARINPQTLVVHEALEDEFWTLKRTVPEGDRLVLSWHGTASNLQYLDTVVPWIAEADVPVSLIVVMPEYDHLRNSNRKHVMDYPVPTQFVVWRKETWVSEVANAHVAIVPLPSTTFCFAKGQHKAVSAMALGMPCIASDLPPYREVVRHGETGFLASTPEEWKEAVVALSDDATRKRIGEAGREFSLCFTRQEIGNQWNRILEGVCSDAQL